MSSIVIGAAAGVICYSACLAKAKFGYDDSLDVVGVHCVGGIIGALLTGVFASKAVNPAGNDGLLFGNPGQLAIQATAVGATLVFAAAGTAVILLILKPILGLRLSEEDERIRSRVRQKSDSAISSTHSCGGLSNRRTPELSC